jgi:outer membrane lipoprotein SlyB
MKRLVAVLVVISVAFIGFACTDSRYGMQKGALVGAGLGAIAGQVIGRSTAGTLIGLAGGALAGALVGDAMEKEKTYNKVDAMESQQRSVYASPQPAQQEAPPGQWVTIPGQWVGGKWVPEHKAWVPVNP